MKKIALFLTAVLCLTLCLMILASAEGNTEEPAPESEGFRYRLLEDGTAEILAYTGKELALVLPERWTAAPSHRLEMKLSIITGTAWKI